MPLKSKHIVEEIDGTRCTIVEKGITADRCTFLKGLLEFNKFEVVVVEEKKETEDAASLFTIGVTDLVFSPVIAVYEMSLKTPAGERVSPDYWDQKSTYSIDQYWLTPEDMQPGGSAWFYKEEA
jgi:hypothetical protein